MMKKTFTFLLLLTGTLSLAAQDFEGSIKRWSDGPLTWEDFSVQQSGFPVISRLQYNWHGATQSSRVGNLKVVRFMTENYMNPVSSWVNPDYRNPATLLYNQTAFDYTEVCRRRLQQEIDQGAENVSPSELARFYYSKADRFIQQLEEETDQGRDTALTRFYAVQVAEELAAVPEPEAVPAFRKRNFGMGMLLGYGNETYLGTPGDYFGTLHGVKMGFDFSFKDFYLYWHFVVGGSGLRRDLAAGMDWSDGHGLTGMNMEWSLGYPVVDNAWWKVSPFAGIGMADMEISFGKDADGRNITDDIGGFRVQAGLSTDLKFFRMLDLSNRPVYYYGWLTGSSRGYSEYAARLFVYAAWNRWARSVGPGWSLNFGLAFNMHVWNVR